MWQAKRRASANMLRLLLDEHVPPRLAPELCRRRKDLTVTTLAQWEAGRFTGVSDHILIEEAFAQSLNLVTFDRKTIPPLLKMWSESGRDHAGVIFVDPKTISPSDFDGLVHALSMLCRETAGWDWTNRVVLLRR